MALSLASLVAAYLIGSLSGSVLLGRLRGIDIRRHGSGNAGGTNALRTAGWWFALGVVVIDVGKGALAAWLALRLAPAEGPLSPAALAFVAGLMAIVGHCWPLWHGFRGGKGAATLIGVLVILWPGVVLPMLALWLIVIGLSGYVGLATVLAAWLLPLLAWWQAGPATLTFALTAALLIGFTHRGNLARLAAGSESRFERARVLRWRRRRDAA